MYLIWIIEPLVVYIPLLVCVALYTLFERKLMAAIQRRKGPNVVGVYGLLQPLADGLKAIIKEIVTPSSSNSNIFIFAPLWTFIVSLLGWAVIPWSFVSSMDSVRMINSADISYGILFLFAISGLEVFGVIWAGWASNSRYSFLGALRSLAQMVSYEIAMSLAIVPIICACGTFNFNNLVLHQKDVWLVWPLLPVAVIFFISMLAETNRAPFDLPEAEAELVAGFNVEYSAITFAMFFLGEYSAMILMCAFFSLNFLGGWLPLISILSFIPIWMALKVFIFCFFYVFVRANYPRYRYDQLMSIGWKTFMPILLSFIIYFIFLLIFFDGLPASVNFFFKAGLF